MSRQNHSFSNTRTVEQVCTFCELENKLVSFHFENTLFEWPRDLANCLPVQIRYQNWLQFHFWTFDHRKMSNKSCFGIRKCDYVNLSLSLFQVQSFYSKPSISIWINWQFIFENSSRVESDRTAMLSPVFFHTVQILHFTGDPIEKHDWWKVFWNANYKMLSLSADNFTCI